MAHSHRERDAGFTTIQYVVATAFSLLLFVLVANLLVDLYERGAVRDALDEGVRAGVPIGATAADCEARAHDVVRSIANGSSVLVEELKGGELRIMPTEQVRDRIRDIGQRVVDEHAEALQILAEHNPDDESAKR